MDTDEELLDLLREVQRLRREIVIRAFDPNHIAAVTSIASRLGGYPGHVSTMIQYMATEVLLERDDLTEMRKKVARSSANELRLTVKMIESDLRLLDLSDKFKLDGSGE